MKFKFVFIPIILIYLLYLFSVSCQKQQSRWKGTIERKNGITVVKNPKEPIYKKDVFNLEEEVSIGRAEGEEEYILSRINGIDVDNEGNIYIIDDASAHIRVFDKNGEYLRTIGRKGQGPGEMQKPIFVHITSQDEVIVHDYFIERLIFFSLDGKYLRQKSTARTRYSVFPIELDSHGNLIGIEVMAPPPIGGKELKKYDSNLNTLIVIAKEEQGIRGEFDIAKPSFYCDVSPNDNIVWGDSKKYELQILNPEGELIKKIQKKYDPLKITAKDKELYKKRYSEVIKRGGKLNFPDHFPAFRDISVDDKERIFIKTYDRVESKEDFFYFDVFDSEGKYIAKVLIEVNLNRNSIWKRNKLYTIETDDKGFQVVNRYKVIWNLNKQR